MARYDSKYSKTEKLLETASNVIPFKRVPKVIPRDKLEAAHLRVREAQDREKYFIITTLIAFLVAFVVYNIK